MRSRLGILFTILGIGLFSLSASATPKTWTLVGVTFNDGGTASGTFVYDADTHAYSSVAVTTTPGTSITTSTTFSFLNPSNPADASEVVFDSSNAGDLTGTEGFGLQFNPPLADALTSTTLGGLEGTCDDSVCHGPNPPTRNITAGTATSAAVASSAPLPTLSLPMLALLSVALAGVGVFLLRRF